METGKSRKLALVLAILWPGLGHAYLARWKRAFLFCSIGVLPLVAYFVYYWNTVQFVTGRGLGIESAAFQWSIGIATVAYIWQVVDVWATFRDSRG